jgi:hypothetical protein
MKNEVLPAVTPKAAIKAIILGFNSGLNEAIIIIGAKGMGMKGMTLEI